MQIFLSFLLPSYVIEVFHMLVFIFSMWDILIKFMEHVHYLKSICRFQFYCTEINLCYFYITYLLYHLYFHIILSVSIEELLWIIYLSFCRLSFLLSPSTLVVLFFFFLSLGIWRESQSSDPWKWFLVALYIHYLTEKIIAGLQFFGGLEQFSISART